MTYDEWEQGKRLTIHNATKAQLKFMVKDRDETIRKLMQEIEMKDKALNEAFDVIKNLLPDKIEEE